MHVAPDTIVDGRYRALKRLGTGGMAEVWCAEDEVLGRRVALKLLGGRLATDPGSRERFRRGARAAAGLTHPNIVGISTARSGRGRRTSRWSSSTGRRSRSSC